jgi:microcystin-dependent protein
MADPFVGEIRIFGFNFAPTGWAQCNNQLLPISQNTALFSLLGTFYGGNGQTTFALPGLEGSVPIHQGQGAGLSEYFIGQSGGSQFVTLLQSEMPIHNHSMNGLNDDADIKIPDPTRVLAKSSGGNIYTSPPNTNMNLQACSISGGSLPHNNMMPYLTLNFCIALQGVFPARP